MVETPLLFDEYYFISGAMFDSVLSSDTLSFPDNFLGILPAENEEEKTSAVRFLDSTMATTFDYRQLSTRPIIQARSPCSNSSKNRPQAKNPF